MGVPAAPLTHPVLWTLLPSLSLTRQDEKNQMMTTNVWLRQVRLLPTGRGAGIAGPQPLPAPFPDKGSRSSKLLRSQLVNTCHLGHPEAVRLQVASPEGCVCMARL